MCFDTWDKCLELLCQVIKWDRWPKTAQMALFAIYPAVSLKRSTFYVCACVPRATAAIVSL